MVDLILYNIEYETNRFTTILHSFILCLILKQNISFILMNIYSYFFVYCIIWRWIKRVFVEYCWLKKTNYPTFSIEQIVTFLSCFVFNYAKMQLCTFIKRFNLSFIKNKTKTKQIYIDFVICIESVYWFLFK